MGVNTDGAEISPISPAPDRSELPEEACKFDAGLLNQKPANGNAILLSSLQNMPSQHTSDSLNTDHNEENTEHANCEDDILSNTTQQPNADIVHRKSEVSQGIYGTLDNNTSADDKCNQLEEFTSPLHPAAIIGLIKTDVNEDREAVCYSLMDEKYPLDDSAFTLDLSFNPDVEQMEEGYTPLYKAALEGHIENVDDLISRGAKPNEQSKGGLRPLHAAAQEGHGDIVDFLIVQGGDVNVECDLGQTPLHTAAANGYINIVDTFIAEGSDINKTDANGWTPFNAAVQYGHLEVVENLVTKGANSNIYNGITPFYSAVRYGHFELAEFFVLRGADVNEESDRGLIPLHSAAGRGHTKVMEYLIQQGSDVNKGDTKGWTPFNAAVQFGHLEAVQYLMTNGARQNRYAGMTPLYLAAKADHLYIVEFFIAKGADVNEEDDEGRIPLHGAAERGHIKVIEYLIQKGSYINKKTNRGCTPFDAAVHCGQLEAVKYLVTKGAKQNRYAGMTPLYAAAKYGHLNLIEFFASQGADMNEEDDKGRIALHSAAAMGNINVMEYLIQQGSDVNKKDNTGWTPFDAAIYDGHLEAIKSLKAKGAKQMRYDGVSPLYAAAELGYLEVVEFFISEGTDANEEDEKGMIPLHGAAAFGRVAVIKYLIKQGSDVNKKDNTGWTPFNAAVQCGHLDIVQFFISKGAEVNEENEEGKIPLHGAAAGGNIKVIGYLIQQGSDVNKCDAKGFTPFNAAVQHGHLEAVKYLMTKGAKQNRYDGMTPLFFAAQSGHLDIVEFLISQGADVNEENADGKIPLHGAASKGHKEVMEYLIQQRSDLSKKDSTGWTPFNAAVQHGQLQAVIYPMTRGAKQNRYDGKTKLCFAENHVHEFFISKGAKVNEEDKDGWTPLYATQEGHRDVDDFLATNGTGMHLRDFNALTPLQAAENEGHSKVLESLTLPGGDAPNEDTGNPRYGSYVGGTKHLTRISEALKWNEDRHCCESNSCLQGPVRGFDAEQSSDEPAMNIMDVYTLPHANEKEVNAVSAEYLTKEPTAGEKRENSGIYLFTNTTPKYPDKSSKTENQEYVAACIGPLQRESCTDLSGASIPENSDRLKVSTDQDSYTLLNGGHTWTHNRFDQHFLNTTETNGHPYEETDSRCHPILTDSSLLINAGCDKSTEGTSKKFDSVLRTNSLGVFHQKSYEGDPFSTRRTSLISGWKIKDKRRTSNNPPILVLVQTFLQMIIPLAIILAGSPVLAEGSDITERLTLQAGKPAIVPFSLSWTPDTTSQIFQFFTVRFTSKQRPFCINGKSDIEGFKSTSQFPRFTTSVAEAEFSLYVNLKIDTVDTVDEDTYVLTAIILGHMNSVQEIVIRKEIQVQIPPGPAICFITISEHDQYPYEAHCKATTGNTATALACYQNGEQIPMEGDITNEGPLTRSIFLLSHYSYFSCCSYNAHAIINETVCQDFVWPHVIPGDEDTYPTTSSMFSSLDIKISRTSEPTHTFQMESGTSKQFMISSIWPFTLTYLVTIAVVC